MAFPAAKLTFPNGTNSSFILNIYNPPQMHLRIPTCPRGLLINLSMRVFLEHESRAIMNQNEHFDPMFSPIQI